MNKKKLVLISKCLLLISILGTLIPVFDESNLYEAIGYFLTEGSNVYRNIGIFSLLIPVSICLSILSSIIIYFTDRKKAEYRNIFKIIDICFFALMIVTTIASVFGATHLEEETVKSAIGVKFLATGYFLSFLVYLIPLLFSDNMTTQSEERRSYWLLCLPAIIFYFGVMAFPSIFSVVLSFTDYSGGQLFQKGSIHFKGFANYLKVFKDQYFYISLKNNLWIVLISVFGQLPLGFFLAYIINRGLIKGKDFFQTMIYLPCVISTVVIGILFQTFFSANGAWTDIMLKFNPNYEWIPSSHPIIPVLFVMLWMYTGTYLIIFLSNLQKIDPEIIEAATIDGATEWQCLWNIIFPQLSGVFVISAILAISGSLKSFDLIYVMTGGGPAKQTYVLSLYMFDKAFKGAADYPMANTISTIMVVISLILIVVVKSLEKKFGAREE